MSTDLTASIAASADELRRLINGAVESALVAGHVVALHGLGLLGSYTKYGEGEPTWHVRVSFDESVVRVTGGPE